jgi:hypothetical protein
MTVGEKGDIKPGSSEYSDGLRIMMLPPLASLDRGVRASVSSAVEADAERMAGGCSVCMAVGGAGRLERAAGTRLLVLTVEALDVRRL